jgi:hypothetical protein
MRKTIKVYDSAIDVDLTSHRIFAVSYDPRWQQIRERLSVKTPGGIHQAIAECTHYYATASQLHEKQCRAWRTANFANAIPLGQPTSYGTMVVPRESEDTIVNFRAVMMTRIKEVGKPEYWDWHDTRKVIAEMTKSPLQLEWLRKHARTLLAGRANASRMQPKRELHYYLNMIIEAVQCQ